MAIKYGCTPAGYDSGRIGVVNPWWQHPAFPIVPQYEHRKGDEWNANGWNFSWLWLRLWSLEHFALEVSIELESTGLNIKAIVPYVRIVFRVLPLPYWWADKLRRKPEGK